MAFCFLHVSSKREGLAINGQKKGVRPQYGEKPGGLGFVRANLLNVGSLGTRMTEALKLLAEITDDVRGQY